MKIILTERVPSLGNIGDVINVSPGYARNYLLPNSLCIVADENNQRQLAHYKKMLASKMAQEEQTAQEMAEKIEGTQLEFVRKAGSGGKIFAPVTTGILSKEFAAKGIEVAKKLIFLEKPIKTSGTFEGKVKLFKSVEASFSIKVVADSSQESETGKKKAKSTVKKKAVKKKDEEESGKKTDG